MQNARPLDCIGSIQIKLKTINKMNSMGLTIALVTLVGLTMVSASALQSQQDSAMANLASVIDSPALRVISDEDATTMQHIKYHIGNEFANFKSINEVHAFLDKAKLLVQKHPKNVAFAQGDLKDLYKFLNSEIVTKLIRVDTDPFILPIADDKIPFAQRAIDDDELTRKLFGGPLRSLIEAKRQQLSRSEEGNHKDGNFFSNFWCKISGGCSN